ncbi:hypothetical protein RNAN_3649 [Rheinheimera nanhaiensis E407-8]|uniref:Uncharacterized protein n=1 Tax=Rheinheimera nanhaiensis E407-8 TaxID=562729 RepID=I1E2U5_9GAMM|nr:hypothetical protein RNAN_3649 [Rheinheimera nanhaiensis E407-8]
MWKTLSSVFFLPELNCAVQYYRPDRLPYWHQMQSKTVK